MGVRNLYQLVVFKATIIQQEIFYSASHKTVHLATCNHFNNLSQQIFLQQKETLLTRKHFCFLQILTRPDLLGFLKNDGMEIAKNSFKKCSPCL
jgi:hypothetical protein